MGTFVENVNAVAGVITSGVLDPNAAGYSNAIIATEQANIATSMATICTDIYDQFDDRYLGSKAVAPALDNDGNALLIGALYFNTVANLMKVYGSLGWVSASSSVNGTTERHTYTATEGQTSFTANYESGYVDVYLNGSKLQTGVDFTATSGTAIVLTTSANVGDIIDIVAYGVFEVANTTPKGNEAYTVSTVADLVSVPSSYTTAIVKDLDRGGTFIWSSTGTANGGTVFAGATGYWNRQYSGAVNVKWFGAKGDGIADDTLAIQKCIDIGGIVFVPQGIWLHTGIIFNSSIKFTGEGASSTVLQCVGINIDSIKIGNGSNNPNDVMISDISIQYSSPQTSSSAITVTNGHSIKLERLRFGGGVYDGISLNGGVNQFLYYLNDIEMNSPAGCGVQVGKDGTLVQDLWFSDSIISGAVLSGINLLNVSGFYFKDIDLLGCYNGIRTYPSSGKQVVAGILNNVLADTCLDWGWNLIDNGGLVSEIALTSCWASTCGTSTGAGGLLVNSGVGSIKGLQITGGSFTNNKGSGLTFLSGIKINLVNVQSFCNSTEGSGISHGIAIGAGVTDWSIIGGAVGLGGLFGTNLQGYGIMINAGVSNNYSIIGVDVRGNVSGGISDGGTGGIKYIYGCPGYITSSSGAALISIGSNNAIVPHGLSVTPNQTDVIISPTVDINAGGVSRYWVSAVSASSFTISVNAATSANLFFAWQVRTKGA